MSDAVRPGTRRAFSFQETTMRRINDEGLALIKRWEGFRAKAYLDTAGIWTVGYGHTSDQHLKVTKGTTVTEARAEELLRLDLAEAEVAVERLVTDPLTDGQFAALVSFVFNVGAGAFAKSTLLKRLNAGDYDAVPAQLQRWVNSGGRKTDGLVNRRAAEAGLWARGAPVASRTVAADQVPLRLMTPELVASGGSALAGLGAVAAGSGPMQWALAAVVILAAATAAVFIVRRAFA
jgi:lysozyme